MDTLELGLLGCHMGFEICHSSLELEVRDLAAEYKKLVQKKIDLSALHKKIAATHSDLGKLIDDLREAGKKNIMSQGSVKDMLARLDELKADAAALEEEVERLRVEEPPQEEPQGEEQSE